MAKKQAMAQFHQEAISRTAEKLFAQNGLEKTTMDSIAQQADYSKATLYVYFKSKEEIFYYLCARSMQPLLYRIKGKLQSEPDLIALYFALCEELQQYYEQYPTHYELLTKPILPQSRLTSACLLQIHQTKQRIAELLLDFFRRAQDAGVFRQDIKSATVASFFWSAASGILMFQEPFAHQSFELLLHSVLEEPPV